jgi:hypothetical protein
MQAGGGTKQKGLKIVVRSSGMTKFSNSGRAHGKMFLASVQIGRPQHRVGGRLEACTTKAALMPSGTGYDNVIWPERISPNVLPIEIAPERIFP